MYLRTTLEDFFRVSPHLNLREFADVGVPPMDPADVADVGDDETFSSEGFVRRLRCRFLFPFLDDSEVFVGRPVPHVGRHFVGYPAIGAFSH